MNHKVLARLMPLYLATFFENLVLWYAIEKPFQRLIGFSDASIGLSLSIMLLVSVALEAPSGILADRWSRKKTLQLAYICLATATFIGWVSYSVIWYSVALTIWGAHWALVSGIKSSIVYDVILEEEDSPDTYSRYYGRLEVVGAAGLIVGSLLSGLVAQYYEIRMTYLLTIPATLAAVIALGFFREPLLHLASREKSLLKHSKRTFKAVLGRPELYALLSIVVASAVVINLLSELKQLWWIPLGLPIVWFGPLNSLVQFFYAAAGFVAHRLQPPKVVPVAVAVLGSSFLLTQRSIAWVVTGQIVVTSVMVVFAIVANQRLNDVLPSEVRAGAGSVVSLVANVFALGSLALFGLISDQYGVSRAAWLVTILLVVIVAGSAKEFLLRKTVGTRKAFSKL